MDLQAGQSFWTRIFQKLGITASLYHFLKRIRNELKTNEILVEEFYDLNGYLSAWSLTGIVLGRWLGSTTPDELRYANTDKHGLLYIKIVANGYNWDVEVYNNSSRSVVGATEALVAKATNVVAGAVGTLVEQTDSGVSGLVTVEPGVGVSSDIWIRPKVGILAQIQRQPVDDELDAYFVENMNSTLTNVVNRIGSAITDVESFARRYLVPYLGQKVGSGESQVLDSREKVVGNDIYFEHRGILLDFLDAMDDETVPGNQRFHVDISPAAVPVLFDVDNIGKGRGGGFAETPWTKKGLVTFRCVVETIGIEQFEAKFMGEDGSIITASHRYTIDKNWWSLDIGLFVQSVKHDPVDAGAEADHFSTWTLYGISSNYSNKGKLYCTISGVGTVVDFYSDTGRTTKVAEGAIAAGLLTITEYGNSGIAGSAFVAGVPADGNGLEVDLKPFKEGDKFYIDLLGTTDTWIGNFLGIFKCYPDTWGVGPYLIDKEVGSRGYSGLKTEL